MMKWIKRIFLAGGALVLASVLFLVVTVVIDRLGAVEQLAVVSNTTIPGEGGGPDVRAYVARPNGSGPFPVVIMIHEFYGLNESIVGKAQGLAEEGYIVIAPDTFRGSTTSWIPSAIYQVLRTPQEEINQDLDSVFAWLSSQPDVIIEQTGTVGFCYGGRASLTYSLHNPNIAATVVFYGSPETDPAALASLGGPVLGIFGGADQSIPLEEVAAFESSLNAAGIPNEITIFEGQPHAFVTDIESIRAGGAQGEAWAQMLSFLERNLKQRGNSLQPSQPADYQPPFAWKYYLVLVYEHTIGSASHHSH